MVYVGLLAYDDVKNFILYHDVENLGHLLLQVSFELYAIRRYHSRCRLIFMQKYNQNYLKPKDLYKYQRISIFSYSTDVRGNNMNYIKNYDFEIILNESGGVSGDILDSTMPFAFEFVEFPILDIPLEGEEFNDAELGILICTSKI